METKRHRRSCLGDLPFDVLVQIAGNITTTSWSPMEDLRTLQGTCRFMRRLCRNPKVGRRTNLGRVPRSNNRWSPDGIAYQALLHRLTNIGNPQACFIIGMRAIFPGPVFTAPGPVLDENLQRAATGGHKAAAYVATILPYMANGGADIDATARQYMRQAAMGEEDSVAAPEGGGVTMWLDRLSCRHDSRGMIWGLINWDWLRSKKIVLPARADDHPCASENCGTHIDLG
ncbi:hypothetical protein PVAP13_8KG163600 [Panicum virgatum]|uniref:F-box domain containing protein n=1 Tax=Panicum virgatum TaxID=38727 RepID=A0A8T0PTW1_PANVG|nr:hypothetical protein PVAP13_8KG163600 [Panicum virgatum]